MTELLRLDIGVLPRACRVRHVAPLFCDRPVTLCAHRSDAGWRIDAADHRGLLAAQMEIEVQ